MVDTLCEGRVGGAAQGEVPLEKVRLDRRCRVIWAGRITELGSFFHLKNYNLLADGQERQVAGVHVLIRRIVGDFELNLEVAIAHVFATAAKE